MANIKLTPEVTSVLERSTITEDRVKLPAQLDRKLYSQVNKALEMAGGKWDRKAEAHLFTTDPRAKLGLALAGEAIVDEKQLYQAFYTPPDLAALVVSMADVEGCAVLEPSAGEGALADACRKAGARQIVCAEIRPAAIRVLLSKKHYSFCAEPDFLEVKPERYFERVVMNPPFSRGQDLRHIAHALRFVRAGGTLVSILLDNKSEEELETLLGCHAWHLTPLGPDAFKSAGTNVKTAILTVHVGG